MRPQRSQRSQRKFLKNMRSRYKRFDTETVNFMGSTLQLPNGFSIVQNSVEIKVIIWLCLENIIFFLFLSYVKIFAIFGITYLSVSLIFHVSS